MTRNIREAIEAWRARPGSDRAAILAAMGSDRERLDKQSSNYMQAEDIAHRNAVLATCDAAIGLLRAAAEPEAKEDVASKTLYGEPADAPCIFCGHVEPHTLRDSTSATHRRGCSRLGCGCDAAERISR